MTGILRVGRTTDWSFKSWAVNSHETIQRDEGGQPDQKSCRGGIPETHMGVKWDYYLEE